MIDSMMNGPLHGIAVSPGVAIAAAHCFHNIPAVRAAAVDESRLLTELSGI